MIMLKPRWQLTLQQHTGPDDAEQNIKSLQQIKLRVMRWANGRFAPITLIGYQTILLAMRAFIYHQQLIRLRTSFYSSGFVGRHSLAPTKLPADWAE